MMTKLYKIDFIVFCLFCLSFVGIAEVFTISPFSEKGSAGRGNITTVLKGRELWTESVVVNGFKTGMCLTLLGSNLKESLFILKKQFPGATFKASRNAVLVEITGKNGSLQRLYLVELGGVYPVMQFSMNFPNGLPKNSKWPKELPIPSASTPTITISLPDRKVVYGTFTTLLPGDTAMSDITTDMISDGWKNMEQGVFLKSDPLSIMLVSFSEDKDGKNRGFVLKRLLD